MNESRYDILGEVLPAIDPAALSYQQWVDVGFALKDGGFTAQDWEDWSRRDAKRYHPGECVKKWASIRASGVTLGTLVKYARDQGWTPARAAREDRAYDWNDTIGGGLQVIDSPDQVELHPLPRLFEAWHPGKELSRYLELLFDSTDYVAYCVETWQKDGRFMPTKGIYNKTAGDLLADIAKHGDDLGAVIGDANPEAGAWIRFNPFDGQGVRNENVTEYRYALVESDTLPVEQQYALYREMELPARVLVHSGGKSLHAIVHIGARDYNEYRERVAYLYKVCEANGLKIDTQNKNPSRLSRMPGVMRGEHRQYIVAENIGRESFEAWREYVESVNDDLPDPENLAEVWDKLPELSPPLIEGVLRQGHKLLLAGPSKAGKSFALLELCVAIAEGRPWMGFGCAQGRVLYVNLELDRASCLNRLRDVYKALGVAPENAGKIDVWNLRGSAVPMDKLAPKLIRRAQKRDYIAVIIDPIYKVITGDENSADQMAKFCNQFDLICNRLGCAVIYCHHHSKGAQGQKSAMDRASGSGVFARDPDALLDMIELPVSEALQKAEADRAGIEICKAALDGSMMQVDWRQALSQDDQCSYVRALAACERLLAPFEYQRLIEAIQAARARLAKRTAWRIEGTLREFAPFAPVNVWFEYPVHTGDRAGVLGDAQPESEKPWYERGKEKRRKKIEHQKNGYLIDIQNALDMSGADAIAIDDLTLTDAKGKRINPKTIKGWLGNGNQAQDDLKKAYEKFMGEDGRAWLRRRNDTDTDE